VTSSERVRRAEGGAGEIGGVDPGKAALQLLRRPEQGAGALLVLQAVVGEQSLQPGMGGEEEIAVLVEIDRRFVVADREMLLDRLIEGGGEGGDLHVLRRGELLAHAAGRARRRRVGVG
jgi:hypothetical protein